jgi:hypothetical protein
VESVFRAFGGVAREVLLDNAKALILYHDPASREVVLHPRLHAFARHWRFRIRACAPYRARTKGKDERGAAGKRGGQNGRGIPLVASALRIAAFLAFHLAWRGPCPMPRRPGGRLPSARPFLGDLGSAQALVAAVIPLGEVRLNLSECSEPGKLTGLLGALARAA